MFHDHSHRSEQLATLAAQVRVADEATPEMFSEIVGQTCQRPSAPNKAANAAQLHQLIEAGALTEAAFALINLELPQWKLRRITYDEGEWHCALSRQRELPDWLDQSIESHHPDLTLAILRTFVDAQRITSPSSRPSVPT